VSPARPLNVLSGVGAARIAVDDGNRQVCWSDLASRSTRFGHGLEAAGAAAGDHVAICVGNRSEFVESVLGAWRAGCAYTPVKTGWTEPEIAALLGDAATRVVVTDQPAARAAALASNLPVVDLDAVDFESWLAEQDDEPFGDDRCGYKLPYTSGTTGRPKGVVMSGSGTTPFAAGWAGIARWAEALRLPGTGAHLFVSRMFNGAPQTFGFGAMARGATLRILPAWDAATALTALAEADVTSTIMVPTMFRQLLALPDLDRTSPPSPSLRTVLHGGEPCPAAIKHAIADWFGEVLVEYYGFTEGGMTVIGADEWRARPGSVGRPLADLSMQILDATGERVPANTEGTVYFSLPAGRRFHYRGDAEKTAEAHHGDSFTVNDIGWIDDDGYLYLSGRHSDVIVSAGVNVYPAEIEHALTEVAGVADLCAVGQPDPERGEAVRLYVALLPGADVVPTLSALAACGEARLAAYKRPREVVVIASIPRDQTGKLVRQALRDPLWREHTGLSEAPRSGGERSALP
jgi:long-chain acyl-CoA synthetase